MNTLTGKSKLPLPFKHANAKKYHGFLGKSFDDTFFGVELEYELDAKTKKLFQVDDYNNYLAGDFLDQYDNDLRHHVNKINRDVGRFSVIKDDGSLRYGLEIASAPTSYVKHKSVWNDFFNNFKEYGLKSNKNCGMHIHVSRDNLTKDEVEGLREFFDEPDNQSFLEGVAGRKENKYCHYGIKQYCKYSALNILPNDTIEFRIFKAPKNKQEFICRLQLIRALTLWVRGRAYLTLNSLKSFIHKNPKFKELSSLIIKSNL